MNWFSPQRIFLDYASATPVRKEVRVVMEKYWSDNFFNPNAIYREGQKINNEVQDCKERIARLFGAQAEGVIFTSGGTEANVLVVRGVKPGKIIIEPESHPSISDAAQGISGKEVTLVSSVTTSNKLGRKIREERKKKSSSYPLLHIDASQTALYFNVGLEALAADFITLDGAKLYGPKGIGAIIMRRGAKLDLPPQGTPAVPLIVGFTKALELAFSDRETESKRLSLLSRQFEKIIKNEFPQIETSITEPNVINVSIPGVLPELMVLALDRSGVLVSAGPACNFNKPEPYGIHNMDSVPVRISLGKFTTESEVKKAAEIFCREAKKMLK